MCKSKSYLKSLLTGINLILILTIASVMLTGIVASYDFGLFGSVISSSNGFYLAIVLAGIFGVATLIYMLCNLKNGKVTFADTLAGAFVLVGLGFFAYVYISTGTLNIRRILAAALLFVVGIIYIIIRANCKKNEEDSGAKGYFSALTQKFPLPFIALLTIAVVSFTYLFFTANFVDNYFKASKVIFAVTILFVIPLIVTVFKKANSKTITILDALIIPCGVALAFSLTSLILKDYSSTKLTTWLALLSFYCVIVESRLAKFDIAEKEPVLKPVESTSYANALFGTYNIFEVLALPCTMILISTMLLRSGALVNSLSNGLDVGFLPIFVLIVAIACVLAYGCVRALLGANKKQIGVGDYWVGVLASFAGCGFISLLIYPSVLLGYSLVIFSIFVLIVLIIRTKRINRQ